jgi:Mrp family chromosome partitioning ATPase
MTFPRAMRMLKRLWWIPLVLAVLGALAASQLVKGKSTTYSATGRLHVQETLVGFSPGSGDPSPVTPITKAADLSEGSFVVPEPARTAAKSLGAAVSGPYLTSHLNFTALSGTDSELTLTGQPSRDVAAKRLVAYLNAYVAWKRDAEVKQLQQVDASLKKAGTNTSDQSARRIETAISTIPRQITASQSVDTTAKKGFPKLAAILGGLIAGLALGVLAALLFGRLDERVRRGSEVEDPGDRPLDIDSVRRPQTMHTLRCELELAGMAGDGATLAVTSPSRSERQTPVAMELARAFAASGRPTVLVSADVRAGSSQPSGVASYLDGTDAALQALQLEDNLVWIPEGTSAVEPEALFSSERLGRLLAEARTLGTAVIVDAPRIEDDAEAPLVAGMADLTLLVIHSGQTTWSRLDSALAHLRRITSRPVRTAVDRASGRGYAAPAGTEAPRRSRRERVEAGAAG